MKYDVVIVGGGLSGLTAGAKLASRGRRVRVLEQHATVGGLAAGFTRKGYYFDSGMSRINRSTILGPLKEFGVLSEKDCRPVRNAWCVEGSFVDADSLGNLFTGLGVVFPEEKAGIESLYRNEVANRERIYRTIMPDPSARLPFHTKIADAMRVLMTMPGFMKEFMSSTPANEVLKRYLDERGRAYALLSVKETELNYRGMFSFVLLVGKWYSQTLNVYPGGGFQSVSDSLARFIVERGGEVSVRSRVKRFLLEGGKCVGVEVVSGGKSETVEASSVVSAVDLRKAFVELLGENNTNPGIMEALSSSRLTPAIPILYLGVRIPGTRIRERFLGREEIFLYPEVKSLSADEPEENFYRGSHMVVHSSSLLVPGHAPEGCSNLQVYLRCPPVGWMNGWGMRDGRKTGDYAAIKKMVVAQALESLVKIIPELSDGTAVEVCELGTPFTVERYTGNTDGSGCGFTMDGYRLGPSKPGTFFDRLDGIENLFFIGQQTGSPGAGITAFASGKRIGKLL